MRERHFNAACATAIFLAFIGCGRPSVYTCAGDGKEILDVQKAFLVALPKSHQGFDPMTFDLQKYRVFGLAERAAEENVPLAHYAEGYQAKLFCSAECAEKAANVANMEVDARIERQAEEDFQDSLFRDSLHRGLIKR
jgi:hypothetical protein